MGWTFPHESLIRKIPNRLVYSPILWRHFLSCDSLLSDDFSLCNVLGNYITAVGSVSPCSTAPKLKILRGNFALGGLYRDILLVIIQTIPS